MSNINLDTCINKFSKDRFFIALLPVNVEQNLFDSIIPHTDWVGFNLFDLRRSKLYPALKKRGLKDTFHINDDKKTFLTSTDKDENLIKFFARDCIKSFKSDILDFNPDMAMGPDWFVYEDMTPEKRKENIEKALKLNQECINLENIIPNVHGTTVQEMKDFIEPFKVQGKENFVIPGREYNYNLGDRKKSQQRFSALTSIIARFEKIKIITTGISSPKLQQNLPEISGFVSLGWLIQACYRRLIFNKTYRSIFNPEFFCDDYSCCAPFSKEELASPENNHIRAIHNLKKIKFGLKERAKFLQAYLVN
jgi:hypothetical protein